MMLYQYHPDIFLLHRLYMMFGKFDLNSIQHYMLCMMVGKFDLYSIQQYMLCMMSDL